MTDYKYNENPWPYTVTCILCGTEFTQPKEYARFEGPSREAHRGVGVTDAYPTRGLGRCVCGRCCRDIYKHGRSVFEEYTHD